MRGTAEGAAPAGEILLYLRTAKSEVWLAAKEGMRRWVRRKESWFSQRVLSTKALWSWADRCVCIQEICQWALWLHVLTNAGRRKAAFLTSCSENSVGTPAWADPALSVQGSEGQFWGISTGHIHRPGPASLGAAASSGLCCFGTGEIAATPFPKVGVAFHGAKHVRRHLPALRLHYGHW